MINFQYVKFDCTMSRITLIYPKDDYDAANVAIKVQALAQSRGQKIYVVPKHYGRSKTEVEKNLSNTSVALFISQSETPIDKATIDELKYLMENKIKIIGFLPHGVGLPKGLEGYIQLKRYDNTDANSLRVTLLSFLTEVQKNTRETQNALLIVIGLVLFLFLLAFNSDD